MSERIAGVTSLSVWLLGVAVIFGWRTLQHRRSTGSAGINNVSGKPGVARWVSGAGFAATLLLGLAGPLGVAVGTLTPWGADQATTARAVVGVLVAAVGFVGVVLSQAGMGASWRIGVDESDVTELVTGGVFGRVRNPIFSAMVVAQAGVAVTSPSVLAVIAVLSLLLAVQVQVRGIEEPYLERTHPDSYAAYAATTGRFVPGIGRTARHTEGSARWA